MCIIKQNKTPLHSFASLVTKQVEQFHSFFIPTQKKKKVIRNVEKQRNHGNFYQKVETNEQSFLHENSPIIYYITITGDYLYRCTVFFILTLYKIYIQAGSLLLKINTNGKLPLVLEMCQDSFVQLLPKHFIKCNPVFQFLY